MAWQWWKDHLGWLLLILLAGGAGKVWQVVSGASKGFLGVSSYLRARQQEYLRQLNLELTQLRSEKVMLAASHAKALADLREQLEDVTRAKDLREDISRQDRESLRQLLHLCDGKKVDYSGIDIHITQLPYE